MKLYSWNVNGLRSALGKGMAAWANACGADVIALQETRLSQPDFAFPELDYASQYFHVAARGGYSGTGLLLRDEPAAVWHDFDSPHDHPQEARVQTVDLGSIYLVNTYVPNAQDELRRLDYRRRFNSDLSAYLQQLRRTKPVVICGDFNVAHEPIDLARPGPNRGKAGYSDEERADFSALLNQGMVDIFRQRHPEEPNHYTWWSFRAGARQRNVGWRLDYFLIDEDLVPVVKEASICAEITGSDHCPVHLELAL